MGEELERHFRTYLERERFGSDQIEAILSRHNLIVEAGAGTGKTRTLVARYLRHLLVDGLSPREIVALTFTEKAASEMAERVFDTLQEFARDSFLPFQERARERLPDLSQGFIRTFHSFCSYLIREYPIETEVDPTFAVLDKMGEAVLLEESINNYISRHLESSPLSWLLSYWTATQLRSAIFQFFGSVLSEYELSEVEGLTTFSHPDVPLSQLDEDMDLLLSHRGEVEGLLRSGVCSALFKKLILSIDTLAWLHHLWKDEHQPGILARLLREMESLPSWGRCNHLRELERLRDAPYRYWPWLDLKVSAPIYQAFFKVVAEVEEEFRLRKAREGVLTFSDLQKRLLKGIRGSSPFGEELKSRFAAILVDEYQDTNEIQRELITRLSERKGEKAKDYREASLEIGKLLIVGDPKQSIYGFRGADLAVYTRTKRQLGEESLSLLSRNFRSAREIIDFVNGAFPLIFQQYHPHITPDYVVNYSSIEATRVGGEVWWWEMEGEMEFKEAILHLLAFEREKGKGWGEIALLVRRNSVLVELQRELIKRGIPSVSSSMGALSEREEVKDIILYLKALDNPADEFSLSGLLLSPFVAVSETTLLKLALYRKERGILLYKAWEEAIKGKLDLEKDVTRLEEGWHHFQRLRGLKDRVSIGALIHAVLRETGYCAYLLSHPLGERALANIEKLARGALRFQRGNLFTLSEFLLYLDTRGLPLDEAQDELEAEDAVKLLTVHAAKGLEFPVVILGETWTPFKPVWGSVLFDREAGLGLQIPGVKSPRYYEVKRSLEAKQWEEEKRVLYVALTRARDVLHIVLKNGNVRSSWQRMLEEFADKSVARRGEWSENVQIITSSPPVGKNGIGIKLKADPPIIKGMKRVSVTTLLGEEEGEPALGSIFHKALREITSNEFIEEWYLTHAPLFANIEAHIDWKRFKRVMELFFNSGLYKKVISRAERVFRELSLEALHNGRVIQGRIDCLVEASDAELHLIEYKWDRNFMRRDRDLRQLALYCWILESSTSKAPSRVYLYYISNGETEEIPVSVLRGMAERFLNGLATYDSISHNDIKQLDQEVC